MLTCPLPRRRKLTDWDSDEESSADIAARAKNSRIVVLQGMFTHQELEEDATLLLDLKEDVREECESLGEVTNVTLYDVRFPSTFQSFTTSKLLLSFSAGTSRDHDSSVQGRPCRPSLHRCTSLPLREDHLLTSSSAEKQRALLLRPLDPRLCL